MALSLLPHHHLDVQMSLVFRESIDLGLTAWTAVDYSSVILAHDGQLEFGYGGPVLRHDA